MNNLEVLYEDNHLIVVYKPENILSQSDITGDVDMLTLVKSYIKDKYNKPGNVYVGLIHRLDRPVSGIMVFARTSKAAARLSKQIQNYEFSKHYFAVVNGILTEKRGEFSDYLVKDNDGNTTISNKLEGKKAILEYSVISSINNYSLVNIKLITGRHHQIRVQFASRGYPLYGDQRYGKQDNNQIALTSYQLSFYHPISKEKLIFTRYPNNKGIWGQFCELFEGRN